MSYKSICAGALFLAASLGVASTARAALYSASLANDFSLASNTNTDTWSYRLRDWTAVPATSAYDYLLPDNTRPATVVWGVGTTPSPVLRTDTTGYWGIGRNDSGSDLTIGLGPNVWPAGEVWAHPEFTNTPPGQLVISWLSPINGVINANWAFSQPDQFIGFGNGVAVQVDTLIGGTLTGGVNGTAFSGSSPRTDGGPVSGSLTSLSVSAGDRIYWILDTWGDAGGDVTNSIVTITQVPEPSSMLLLGMGSIAAIHCLRRRRVVQSRVRNGEGQCNC